MARRDPLILLVLLVLTAGIYFSTIRDGHDWGGDFSMYIIHARNLAQGRPYLDTGYLLDSEREPLNPDIPPMAPPSYPPLFPLLLTPLYKFYGLNYHAFKVLVQTLLLLALATTFILIRLRGQQSGPWMAAITVLVFAWSTIVLQLKESVLSESTYLVLAGAALCLALWIYRKKWDERFPAASALALTVLFLLCYATRVTGVSLGLALIGYEAFVIRRVRRFNLYLAAGLGAAFLCNTKFLYSGSSGYSSQLGFTPQIYLANALHYLRSPASLWGACPQMVRWPLVLCLIVLATVGYVRSLRKSTVTEFYVAASILPLILYSSGRSDRYLLPVLPFLPIYATETLQWLRGFLPRRAGNLLMLCGAAIVLTAGAYNVSQIERQPITEGVAKPSFQELSRFLEENTPPESRIVFWNPRVLALYTNRSSAWYVHTDDTARFLQFLSRMEASHVVLYLPNPDDERWVRPHIQNAHNRFQLSYRNRDFEVWKVTLNPTR